MKCLIPILIALPLVSGCDMVDSMVEPDLTPEQTTRLDVLETRNGELEDALAVTRSEALEAVKAADAAAAGETLAKLQALLGEQAAVSAEAEAIIASSPTKLSGFTKFANLIPGPWQYLIPLMGTAATAILGTRSRKWAWITVKNSASVGLVDTLKNMMRTVGAIHSSTASHAAAVADPSSPLKA